MKKITSLQNAYVKNLIKLQEKSRERKKQNLFLIEGVREISLAIKGNYQIEAILFSSEILAENTILKEFDSFELIEVTKEIYQKLAYRNSTEGVVAIAKTKDFNLSNVTFANKEPLIIVAESPEKPGNIGAILRTADAANVDAVFIADLKTDLFNPNIIRNSVGCLFTNQVAVASSQEIITFLKQKNIQIFNTTLQNANAYYKEDFTKASAIVMGTEATGLTKIWRDNATKNIYIPMQGKIDSMNVSVAAAIVTFEAKRQRKFS